TSRWRGPFICRLVYKRRESRTTKLGLKFQVDLSLLLWPTCFSFSGTTTICIRHTSYQTAHTTIKMTRPPLSQNRTLSILNKARDGGYAVAGMCCYNIESVIATVRAAEATNSPAIVQLF